MRLKGFCLTYILIYISYKNDTNIIKVLFTAPTDISQIFKGLRLSNPKNIKI